MDVRERTRQLFRFKEILRKNEANILKALWSDLEKPALEAFASEISPLYEEIDHLAAELKTWGQPKKVSTPWWKVAHFLGSSWIETLPVGRVLILSPWNYPFYLSLIPVLGAFAAGNRIVLKPSEFSEHSSRVLAEILSQWLPLEWIDVRLGGAAVAEELTQKSWGHLFFTGSTMIGKQVMKAAAETLTPVTLELGGKCPVVLDNVGQIKTALKRIWWGKTFNAGQTCVAPDYLLVPNFLKQRVIELSREVLLEFYGKSPLDHPKLGRIVNATHFDRLERLKQGAQILIGGSVNAAKLKIEPTLLEVSPPHSLWNEEIFGPLLILQTYESVLDAVQIIAQNPHPLALYVFTDSDSFESTLRSQVLSGAVCRNDTLVHLSNSALPFGGVKSSGMGAYHGKKSLETFSFQRSIEQKPLWPDLPLRYPQSKLTLKSWLKPFS